MPANKHSIIGFIMMLRRLTTADEAVNATTGGFEQLGMS
jgi:hypothetical protein